MEDKKIKIKKTNLLAIGSMFFIISTTVDIKMLKFTI